MSPTIPSCAPEYPANLQTAVNTSAIEALREWQRAQNGTLIRLEGKIDGLLLWIMGAMLAGTLSLIAVIVQISIHAK